MATKRKQESMVGFVVNMSPQKKKAVRLSLQVDGYTTKKAILFDLSKLAVQAVQLVFFTILFDYFVLCLLMLSLHHFGYKGYLRV